MLRFLCINTEFNILTLKKHYSLHFTTKQMYLNVTDACFSRNYSNKEGHPITFSSTLSVTEQLEQ